MRNLFQDLHHAIRTLFRNQKAALLATFILALGIGATVTIFSVINGVLLSKLPYKKPDRLMMIWNELRSQGQEVPAASPADFLDYRHHISAFEEIAAIYSRPGSITGNTEPEQVHIGRVSANFLSTLGIAPVLGRDFEAGEDALNGPKVVILSHSLWQRQFGGSADVTGRIIRINGESHSIVGVLSSDFRLLLPVEATMTKVPDLIVPLQINVAAWERNFSLLTVIARLNEYSTGEQAQTEMNQIAERLRAEHQIHKSMDTHIRVVSLHHDITKTVRPALLILSGAVALLLLIVCSNVASLMIVRAGSRVREMAIRRALGASRLQIARLSLIESLLLATLGCLGGLVLASWGIDALVAMQPANLPRLDEVKIDASVLGVAAFVSLITVLIIGFTPALSASRADVSSLIKAGNRCSEGPGYLRLRNVIVALQIALSVVLLAGAGLLARTLISLYETHPGFVADHVFTFKLSLPSSRYPQFSQVSDFYNQIEQKLATLPGVESVGVISFAPLSGEGFQTAYAFNEETEQNWESVSADRRNITPNYFEAMGIRLLAGRTFDERDTSDKPFVVVIDENLARRAWPGEDPVGKRLKVEYRLSLTRPTVERRWAKVIGVVEHVRSRSLIDDTGEQVYYSSLQQPSNIATVMIRTNSDHSSLIGPIRQEIGSMDKDMPVYDVRPMSDYVSKATAETRFILTLIAMFSLIALLLSAVGLYGVISYVVSMRTREVGIRMALGATSAKITGMIVGQGLAVAFAGLAAGVAGAVAFTGLMKSWLYRVEAADPTTLFAVSLLVSIITFISSYVPARRAGKIDPSAALRHE